MHMYTHPTESKPKFILLCQLHPLEQETLDAGLDKQTPDTGNLELLCLLAAKPLLGPRDSLPWV